MQVSLNHRSNKGLTVGIAYTWSKILTTNASDRSNEVTDIHNIKMDYGPSNINTPQVFEASYIYTLPYFKGQHGLEGKLLGGWELSGVTSVVSGQNFAAIQSLDPWVVANGNGNGIGLSSVRLDQVGSVQHTKKLGAWFSTNSFAQASGHFGSERANPILGPGLQNWDLATIKNVKFGDRYSLQLRGEYFNAFNHENFSTVDANINDVGTFGTVTAGHEPRRVQIATKFNF
jgi:hypothetical protein